MSSVDPGCTGTTVVVVDERGMQVTRAALGVVTEFVTGDPEAVELGELERLLASGEQGLHDVTAGLLNIVTLLLLQLEALGQPIPDTLADLGRRLAAPGA